METDETGIGSTEYIPGYSYSGYRRLIDGAHQISKSTREFLYRKSSIIFKPVLEFLRSTKNNENSFDDSRDLTKLL